MIYKHHPQKTMVKKKKINQKPVKSLDLTFCLKGKQLGGGCRVGGVGKGLVEKVK